MHGINDLQYFLTVLKSLSGSDYKMLSVKNMLIA